jgi:hypothetical protein
MPPAGGRRGGEEEMNSIQDSGPKYFVNIEDVEHPWARDAITVPEIRSLGAIAPGIEVLEVDLHTNEERTLREDEVVPVKPGRGFGKKIKFKRG